MSMKVTTRQVNEVTIVDLSGQIKLGEGSSVLRDTVKDLLGKGRKKILSFAIIKSGRKRLTWRGMASNNRDPCQSSFCPSFDALGCC